MSERQTIGLYDHGNEGRFLVFHMMIKRTPIIWVTILFLSCSQRTEKDVGLVGGDLTDQEVIMLKNMPEKYLQYPNLSWSKGAGALVAIIDCTLFKPGYRFEGARDEWHDSTFVAFEAINGQTTAAQHKTLLFFLAHQDYYKKQMEEAIANYFQTEVKRLVEPEDFIAMEKKNPADLVLLHHLRIPYEGDGVLGFEFECVWDVEHGMGIKFNHGLITDIGMAEVAI